MNTFAELKKFLKDHKEDLKGLIIRIESYKGSRNFKTLKDLGNEVLRLEKSFNNIGFYSYCPKGTPMREMFKNNESEILKGGNLSYVIIMAYNPIK